MQIKSQEYVSVIQTCDSRQCKTLRLNYPDTYNQSDSLDACTCGGLYCSAEPLPMGFTLPCTRL